MAAKKTERLLNLVICLLATRRYLSVQEIRAAVPGYGDDEGPDAETAFRRMFERDKAELRELGVPLETGSTVHAHDDEVGYRIARPDYELPDLVLDADEAAALGLAARLWQSAPLAGATGSALLKLRAAGVDAPAPAALEPRVAAGEPAFAGAWAAVRDGRRVRFGYRRPGAAAAEQRRVEPWGVVSWHGHWYLVGHDLGRDAERVFRLSRVQGEVHAEGEPGAVTVPEGVRLRDVVARLAGSAPSATARVLLRPGAGWSLRREALSVDPGGEPATGTAASPAAPGVDGWDLVRVGFSDPERLAGAVAALGADAVVLDPPEAVAAVLRRLRALAGADA